MADQVKQCPVIIANREAEEAILGIILGRPSTFAEVSSLLNTKSFTIVRHKMIWCVMKNLEANGKPVDVFSIVDKLHDLHQLDSIGGPAYLMALLGNAPDPNIKIYIKALANLSHQPSDKDERQTLQPIHNPQSQVPF
jgi:replicative DNA helicase